MPPEIYVSTDVEADGPLPGAAARGASLESPEGSNIRARGLACLQLTAAA
jgi:hypothetical protein